MRPFAVLALAALALAAQTAAPKYTFEVASVKPLDPADPSIAGPGPRATGMASPVGGDPVHVSLPHVTLLGVLSQAYGVAPRLVECPDWMRTQFYIINAKVPDDAPKGHIPEMLQSLLADRFHMAVHWETKEETGFALSVGKGGPKLKKSDIPEDEVSTKRSSFFNTSGHLTFKATTMDQFASSLSVDMGKQVANKTDLSGVYDITMDAAPDSMPGLPSFGSHADSQLPSIFTALHQLGLNLEPQKISVKRLIVDSADKVPTGN